MEISDSARRREAVAGGPGGVRRSLKKHDGSARPGHVSNVMRSSPAESAESTSNSAQLQQGGPRVLLPKTIRDLLHSRCFHELSLTTRSGQPKHGRGGAGRRADASGAGMLPFPHVFRGIHSICCAKNGIIVKVSVDRE
jgi:hypothetical protein